jgi:hypothetical protein
LEDGSYVKKSSTLKAYQIFTQLKENLEHTDTRSAVPVQSPLPPASKNEKTPYETRAPKGVDALKNAICFLHSDLGNAVDNRDVVSANAVGAGSNILSMIIMQ